MNGVTNWSGGHRSFEWQRIAMDATNDDKVPTRTMVEMWNVLESVMRLSWKPYRDLSLTR